jgi:4-carboxymuconolactone decarboxylase
MSQDIPPSRIIEVAPEQMSDAQKAGLAALLAGRGRLLTPYRIWLHSPGLMRAMEQLGTFLNKQSSLTEREVELGICLAARHWAGDYVFEAHARRCAELGFSPSVIEAVRRDQVPDLADVRERMVHQVVRLAGQEGAGPDADFDAAVAALGRDGLAEMICLIGYYSAVAIGMKLHRVPLRQA